MLPDPEKINHNCSLRLVLGGKLVSLGRILHTTIKLLESHNTLFPLRV